MFYMEDYISDHSNTFSRYLNAQYMLHRETDRHKRFAFDDILKVSDMGAYTKTEHILIGHANCVLLKSGAKTSFKYM